MGGPAAGPFKKKKGREFIPARPYLVFRPEDPQRITEALQTFIDQQAQKSGLK
jgi:phage gpG-like protein